MSKPVLHVVSLSGGKDSTAMLLRMFEEGWPIDRIIFCDTGLEFPELYDHIDSLEAYVGIPITRLKAKNSFEYFLLEYSPERRNPKLTGKVGLSWPGPRQRWCTARLKTRIIDAFVAELEKEYDVVRYVGIAADEPKRVREMRYPLVEWGMTEEDCLQYCRSRGFDWGGLYDLFTRVSCWCCPLQSFESLRTLRANFPALWDQLKEWDEKTWRTYLKNYSVKQLDTRFAFEDELTAKGQPIRGKAFFDALRKRLEETS